MNLADIEKHLGKDAKDLLGYKCKGIAKDSLHIPGSDWVDRIFVSTDRNQRVLNNSNGSIHRPPGRYRLRFHSSVDRASSIAPEPLCKTLSISTRKNREAGHRRRL